MRWLSLLLVVFAPMSVASPCGVYFDALYRALPAATNIAHLNPEWSLRYRLPKPEHARLAAAWETTFPLGHAASVRSGINADGNLKDPLRHFRTVLPDGSPFAFTLYGRPYRKQGSWSVDVLADDPSPFAAPVLRRLPFTDFFHLLYPAFLQRLGEGQSFAILKPTQRNSSTAEHSLFSLLRQESSTALLRSERGERVRLPMPQLFLHDSVTDPSLKNLWRQIEVEGGQATLLRVLARRGESASGDFLRVERWPKANSAAPVLAFFDKKLKSDLVALEKQGHPVLLASAERHFRGLYVHPRSSSWKQMGGTPVGRENFVRKPALVFTPNFDRYTFRHEQQHIEDTELRDEWQRDLAAWETQKVLHSKNHEADTLLRFLGEQRAYAAEWERFDGELRSRRENFLGFSDRFALLKRSEARDALRERLFSAFAAYTPAVTQIFDRLRQDNPSEYARLHEWLVARARASNFVGLPAGLPTHFSGN